MGVACSWSSAPGIVRYLKKKKLPRNHNRTIYDNVFQLNPQSGSKSIQDGGNLNSIFCSSLGKIYTGRRTKTKQVVKMEHSLTAFFFEKSPFLHQSSL